MNTVINIDESAGVDDLCDVLIVDIAGCVSYQTLARGKVQTNRFLSSLAVWYLSSVVMFSSSPALIGMSWSPGVLPVLISGPFCVFCQNHGLSSLCRILLQCQGRSQEVGRACPWLTDGRCRSQTGGTIVDVRFGLLLETCGHTSYEPCEKFMRTMLRPANAR